MDLLTRLTATDAMDTECVSPLSRRVLSPVMTHVDLRQRDCILAAACTILALSAIWTTSPE